MAPMDPIGPNGSNRPKWGPRAPTGPMGPNGTIGSYAGDQVKKDTTRSATAVETPHAGNDIRNYEHLKNRSELARTSLLSVFKANFERNVFLKFRISGYLYSL